VLYSIKKDDSPSGWQLRKRQFVFFYNSKTHGGPAMKTCSLNEFMQELKPWLDKDHIRKALLDEQGHFVVHFVDGMKNVYHIDDCNEAQIKDVIVKLKGMGIKVEE
jgi:hypothetical protein